eukprot:TRINITY_DN3504_c0_g1_i1.p1 TRINITY_DN3504_c0_g1~~TRINITY_DN3504_c0_g1_i1.p1  ORF type:complete len:914 (+),score=197.19 TRINITY_DN3504_c0_g1_i1:59-2800(+)
MDGNGSPTPAAAGSGDALDTAFWQQWFRANATAGSFTQDALMAAVRRTFPQAGEAGAIIGMLWETFDTDGNGVVDEAEFLSPGGPAEVLSTLPRPADDAPAAPAVAADDDAPPAAHGNGPACDERKLVEELVNMGFTRDQATKVAQTRPESLGVAVERVLSEANTPPDEALRPRHRDPLADPVAEQGHNALEGDDAVIGQQLSLLGFTAEQAELALQHIPPIRKKHNPAGWCLDWRDGALESLQSWEATREDCSTCFSDRASFRMNCESRCVVCAGCLAEYLKERVSEHKVDEKSLQCPNLDGGTLTHDCICAALRDDKDLYDRYLSLAARKEAEKWGDGGEAVFCPACDWFCVVGQESHKYSVKCGNQSCPSQESARKGKFCGMCGEKPHRLATDGGRTCEEYQKWRESQDEDVAKFRQFMKAEKMQVCPNCKEAGELAHGCKWVKCRCGTKYCYHCGRGLPHDKQHYSHWYDGPYGSKCYGGKEDKDGYTAVGGPCADCRGWSYGRTACSCRYWQTGGVAPDGADEEEYQEPESLLQVGDVVRVKPWVDEPKHKWGKVKPGDKGLVRTVTGLACEIHFERQQGLWRGFVPEMEVLDDAGRPKPGQHPGMWRQQPKKFYCSKVDQKEGPVCEHGSDIIQKDHWSCCGAVDTFAKCTAIRLRAGDIVRVKPEVSEPRHKWGKVDRSDRGIVRTVADTRLEISFPDRMHSKLWIGYAPEMEVVNRFEVGSQVMVRPEIKNPTKKWGAVRHGDIGRVDCIDVGRDLMIVNFPSVSKWQARMDEMDLVCAANMIGKVVRVRPELRKPAAGWRSLKKDDIGVVVSTEGDTINADFPSAKQWTTDYTDMDVLWGKGCRVRVKPTVGTPKFGWRGVQKADVGVVTHTLSDPGRPLVCIVKFSRFEKWTAYIPEMERATD